MQTNPPPAKMGLAGVPLGASFFVAFHFWRFGVSQNENGVASWPIQSGVWMGRLWFSRAKGCTDPLEICSGPAPKETEVITMLPGEDGRTARSSGYPAILVPSQVRLLD